MLNNVINTFVKLTFAVESGQSLCHQLQVHWQKPSTPTTYAYPLPIASTYTMTYDKDKKRCIKGVKTTCQSFFLTMACITTTVRKQVNQSIMRPWDLDQQSRNHRYSLYHYQINVCILNL